MELSEIQGIILRGYAELNSACFLLLSIDDAARAKPWLETLPLRGSELKPQAADTCVNIAFTPAGLRTLGLSETLLAMFASEFIEGMAGTAHRRRILGDHGGSSPELWRWGGPNTEAIDALLMLYAVDETALRTVVDGHVERLAGHGWRVVERLDSLTLPGRKEHFGFREGISQPGIEGYSRDTAPANTVAAGEFVFGYPNGHGQYADRPTVAPDHDPRGLLPRAADDPGRRDFGRNGSFVVFRQLQQDVHAFWNYVAGTAPGKSPGDGAEACVALASKMVGRWPGGAPLVRSPRADDPGLADDNEFMYVRASDANGIMCPIGSHIRRCNPRDALDPEPGSDRSIEVGNRHRIIRRGRAYGPPAAQSMRPRDVIGQPDDHVERGLHFICFNTQIGRQFEFIQHTWANSTKFDGLYEDDDPLIGDRGGVEQLPGGTFTIQHPTVRRRVTGMPRFVHVRGGAYFFMPGISAVRYLASLE